MKKLLCHFSRLILTGSAFILGCTICNAQGSTGSASTGAGSMSDTAFISKNIMDNMMEIQLSQMGVGKAGDAKVRSLAQQMVSDHTQILNDLRTIAKKRNMSIASMDIGGWSSGSGSSTAMNNMNMSSSNNNMSSATGNGSGTSDTSMGTTGSSSNASASAGSRMGNSANNGNWNSGGGTTGTFGTGGRRHRGNRNNTTASATATSNSGNTSTDNGTSGSGMNTSGTGNTMGTSGTTGTGSSQDTSMGTSGTIGASATTGTGGGMSGMPGMNGMGGQSMGAMQSLQNASGTEFDTQFVSQMLALHDAKLAELQAIATTLTDPELKLAVTKAIPKVRMHRDILSRINKGTGSNGTNTNQ